MVSAKPLDSGSSGFGSSPGWGRFVVSLARFERVPAELTLGLTIAGRHGFTGHRAYADRSHAFYTAVIVTYNAALIFHYNTLHWLSFCYSFSKV